jgi:hypothetical protein
MINFSPAADFPQRPHNKKGCISRCSLKRMEAQDMEILRFL